MGCGASTAGGLPEGDTLALVDGVIVHKPLVLSMAYCAQNLASGGGVSAPEEGETAPRAAA